MECFPLLPNPLDKPDQQAIHCPTLNFGPLLRGSVTDPMLINFWFTTENFFKKKTGFT